ncbi:hypothetical protein CPB84DRAFT_1851432 [Gymnopilus junonius]|uniref:Uncharacterized protein n=1 Tax=Gymnopilus junonius TaxID=109634 RepID=A0A9P5NGG4_GYMJU|nr:hypothetical protein CPB84DRAFT_1851432 [Gymnopilus junonius]
MTEDGPLNQDIPKIPMEIVEDRSAQQEEDPGAPAFTATATRYVPRPLGHELQRAHVFMHPLAAEQSIATMEVNAAPATPSVPMPMDLESIYAQSQQVTSPSQPTPTPETTAALMHTIPGEYPSSPSIPSPPNPTNIQPPIQFPSPVMAQSGSVPELTSTPPQFQTSLSRDQSRNSQRKNTGVQPPRMRPREAATEKTRLIEQLDLTTRKIIEEKDEQIAKLQAQVKWDTFAARMDELEKKIADNTHNPGDRPNQVDLQSFTSSADHDFQHGDVRMASGAEEKAAHVEAEMSNATLHNTSQCDSHIPADVNQVETPSNNTNNHTELTQAPLAFKGQDINMGGQPNEEPAQVPQAVEDEDVDMGAQTEERHEDEDVFGGDDDSGDEDEDAGDEDDEDPGEEMRGNGQPSVPKPILHFQRPRRGAGPQLQIDPQTSYTANPTPNPPPNVAFQSLNITTEQIEDHPDRDVGTKPEHLEAAGYCIKEKEERAVRSHMNSLLNIKCDREIRWISQPSKEKVDAFAEREGPGPTLVPLALFSPTKRSMLGIWIWARNFSTISLREGPRLRLREREWPIIYEIFWQRFSNLKREWKKWQPKEGEDKTAVNHRNSETTRVTLKSKRRNARRKHLKHLRVAITDGNQIKTDGTKDDVWYFLWLVATELGIGGMSSDESSPDTGRKYVIKSVPWRSEELTPYLQMIDKILTDTTATEIASLATLLEIEFDYQERRRAPDPQSGAFRGISMIRHAFEGIIFGVLHDIVPHVEPIEGGRYALSSRRVELWQQMEDALLMIAHHLTQCYTTGIRAAISPIPSSLLGFKRSFYTLRTACLHVATSRDWFLVWMSLISSKIADIETKVQAQPDNRGDWFAVLVNHEVPQDWLSAIQSSIICDFSQQCPRIGTFLDIHNPHPDQPSVEWFYSWNVPVWYCPGSGHDQPKLEYLQPPLHLLQAVTTFISKVPSPTLPPPSPLRPREYSPGEYEREKDAYLATKPWEAFFAACEAHNQKILAKETEVNVFLWDWSLEGEIALIRRRVNKKGARRHPWEHSAAQCNDPDDDDDDDDGSYYNDHDDFSLGLNTNPDTARKEHQAFIDECVEQVRRYATPQYAMNVVRSSDSGPEVDLTHTVDELNILVYLTQYYGFVPPLPIPKTDPVPVSTQEWDDCLKSIGLRTSAYNCPCPGLTGPIVNFIRGLQGRGPQGNEWDLLLGNRQPLEHRLVVKAFHKLNDKLFLLHHTFLDVENSSDWQIGVTSSTNALYILRYLLQAPEKPSSAVLAQHLAEQGVPFYTFLRLAPLPSSISLDAITTYVAQHGQLLTTPRAHAAILHGGIVGRLAKEHLEVNS